MALVVAACAVAMRDGMAFRAMSRHSARKHAGLRTDNATLDLAFAQLDFLVHSVPMPCVQTIASAMGLATTERANARKVGLADCATASLMRAARVTRLVQTTVNVSAGSVTADLALPASTAQCRCR
jgi:hypothetical protein